MPDVHLTADAVDAECVEETLRRLTTASSIMLEDNWRASASVGLIAAALIGKLRDRPLAIEASGPEAVEGALRFGIASALARRDPERTTFKPSAAELGREDLARTWTTGTRSVTEAMFRGDEALTSDAVGATYATFVNAHLASSAEGHADVVFLLRRWLARRLRPQLGTGIEAPTERVASALTELVANVQQHAARPDGEPADSLLRVAIDDEHVRSSIADNGQGIVATLSPKLDIDDTAEGLLQRLLDGALPRWHGGRGMGLPRVADLVREGGGSIRIASGPLRAELSESGAQAVGNRPDVGGVVAELAFPIRA